MPAQSSGKQLSPAAQLVLAIGEAEARHLDAAQLDVEHVVIGVLKLGDLRSRPDGVSEEDWRAAEQEIGALASHWKRARVNPVPMRRRLRFLLSHGQTEGGGFSGGQTDRCREVLERAEKLAEGGQIDLPALIQACLEERSEPADQVFAEFAIDKKALLPKPGEPTAEERQPERQPAFAASPLAGYGRDLTALARAGELDPVVGRREEMKDIARILSQSMRNNAMLVGEAGVGKTAVVEGLAQYAAQADAHPSVRDLHFVEVTLVSLIAGAQGPADVAGRLLKVLQAAKGDPNLVLFFDEFHALAGAGDILKPALARGEVHCIGATTIEEYNEHIETSEALARRFQRVWIDEPSRDETVQILQGLRPKLEEHHGLTIPDEALQAAVDFTVRHVPSGRLPDKAIIVVDQACARARILTFTPGAEIADHLSVEGVAEVVAKRARLPVERILLTDASRVDSVDLSLEEVERRLGGRVIGQDAAVSALARGLQLIDTGLEQEGRPFVVLFAGPSGTGKTELAKALSEVVFGDEKRLITLDMTRFRQPHEVAELIGSPAGYIGSERTPQWILDIEAQPSSIVLLDEIEKAHRDALTVFMSVFDEGRFVTARGKVADFSHAIFVLTSNLGTGHEEGRMGPDVDEVLPEAERQARRAERFEYQVRQALSRALRPEILGRVNKIVVFQPLGRDALYRILDLCAARLARRRGLSQRRIELVLDDTARDFLIERGFSAETGARNLIAAFEQWVTSPLAESLQQFAAGDRVLCRSAGDKLELVVEAGTPALAGASGARTTEGG